MSAPGHSRPSPSIIPASDVRFAPLTTDYAWRRNMSRRATSRLSRSKKVAETLTAEFLWLALLRKFTRDFACDLHDLKVAHVIGFERDVVPIGQWVLEARSADFHLFRLRSMAPRSRVFLSPIEVGTLARTCVRRAAARGVQ